MTAIKAYYDGHAFIPESPVTAEINQEAIVTLLDDKPLGIATKERLFSFAGSISHGDYLEMEKALEDTERVDTNER
jgi:hypothetical protein